MRPYMVSGPFKVSEEIAPGIGDRAGMRNSSSHVHVQLLEPFAADGIEGQQDQGVGFEVVAAQILGCGPEVCGCRLVAVELVEEIHELDARRGALVVDRDLRSVGH